MSNSFPIVYLDRHGETAWTVTSQHTGLADLPLTERGERNARRLWDDTHQVLTSDGQQESPAREHESLQPTEVTR